MHLTSIGNHGFICFTFLEHKEASDDCEHRDDYEVGGRTFNLGA